MRFTYNQYNYYESGYRIPSKMQHSYNSASSSASTYPHHHHKSNFGMRMTMSTASTMTPRIHSRKGFRTPSKRHPGKALPGKLHSISRIGPGKIGPGKRLPQRPHPPPCDNSNDSGYGFDQHVEVSQHQQQHQQQQQNANCNNNNNSTTSTSTNINNTHNQNNSSHHHSPTGIQHSPQQQLIRAIPSSRSNAVKKLPCTNIEDEEQEFLTDDDSNDYTGRTRTNSENTYSSSTSHSSPTSTLYENCDGQRSHKSRKLETHVELDNDDACSEDAFIRKIASANATELQADAVVTQIQPLANANAPTKFMSNSGRAMTRVAHKRQPAAPLQSIATSSDGRIQLEIISQPEQQHRARYQTEGSRGAVKDRSGNGFPIVRLIGYNKPTVLQVFIGTDIGRVAPHMFYQACKVAGKNSTQCNEKKVDGTMVIEIDFKPESEMTITCDCVGILKERNVDVEHRFPDHLAQKNKKKSTRCRMVFRTQLTHDDGTSETLQVCSNPIICTQPPGVPEICKKSLNSCPVDGGLELFIIGKNFLKDTHVIFQETYDSADPDDPNSEIAVRQQMVGALWEQTVLPDKEYLQQTHLICTVPPYIHQNIIKPVHVQVAIISSGKKSESHSFVYTPKGSYTTLAAATTLSSSLHGSLSVPQDVAGSFMDTSAGLGPPGVANAIWPATETKHEIDSGMMPPPISTQMPMGMRRPSLPTTTPMITDQQLAHLNAVAAAEVLKTELLDENSQGSMADGMHSPEAGNGCDPLSPNAMQYHTRYGRKTSMDAMMYESNSLPGFPVAPVSVPVPPPQMEAAMVAAVEMAVKNEIAKEILNAAVVQQQQQAEAVDKFITDLTKSRSVTTTTNTAQQTLFGVGVPTAEAIDHALTDILQAAPPAVLERSLSISSNSSSHSSGSNASSPMSGASSSPVNNLQCQCSPLNPQDVLLNSEPAGALSVLPIQQLLPQGGTNVNDVAVPVPVPVANNGLSTDILMNPSVSPSTILCSANGAATAVVPNIMSPHQMTMANSILNDIAMQPQPTQQDATVAALALRNIVMSPPSESVAVQPEVTSATTTAVSNMIIKAAADFISNQEQQQQTQQTQHHQQQHQHQHQHQQQPAQQQMMTANSVSAQTTDPLVNLLLNHPDVPPSAAVAVQAATTAAAVSEVQSQFPLGMPPATPQESLIVALAAENALQNSVTAAAVTTNGALVTQQTPAPAAGLHQTAVAGVATAAVTMPPPIPQELTTMSDQDLISYINPSTFDQI